MRFVSLHLKQRQQNKNNINNEWFTELATSRMQLHSTTLAETLLNDILVKKLVFKIIQTRKPTRMFHCNQVIFASSRSPEIFLAATSLLVPQW